MHLGSFIKDVRENLDFRPPPSPCLEFCMVLPFLSRVLFKIRDTPLTSKETSKFPLQKFGTFLKIWKLQKKNKAFIPFLLLNTQLVANFPSIPVKSVLFAFYIKNFLLYWKPLLNFQIFRKTGFCGILFSEQIMAEKEISPKVLCVLLLGPSN